MWACAWSPRCWDSMACGTRSCMAYEHTRYLVDTAASVIRCTSIDRRLSVTSDNTQQSQQQQLRYLWHSPLTFHARVVSHTHTHTHTLTGDSRRCRQLMPCYYVRVNASSCAPMQASQTLYQRRQRSTAVCNVGLNSKV